MACLSTRFALIAVYSTATLVLALGNSSPNSHRNVSSKPLSDFAAGSLCHVSEAVLATCRGHGEIASVCSATQGSATYRFGHPRRIELQSTGLHSAQRMYSGGGETQISFVRLGYEYVIFDETIRTGDTLLVLPEQVVAVAMTWPFAVTSKCGTLHAMAPLRSGETLEHVARALHVCAEDIEHAAELARAMGFDLDPGLALLLTQRTG